MPRHSEAHTRARLNSTFESLVARAADDIRTQLKNPRYPTLKVNDDRKARWEAAARMILSGELVRVSQGEAPTHRAPPGQGHRMRNVVEVRFPDVDDWASRQNEEEAA